MQINSGRALNTAPRVALGLLPQLKMLLLLAGIVGGTVAQAQTPAALIYDTNVLAIHFAAGDVKAALQQNGQEQDNVTVSH